MKISRLFLVVAVALHALGALAQFDQRAPNQVQVPYWALGKFTGHNDYNRVDADVEVTREGKVTLTFRGSKTLEGTYGPGKFVFDNRLEYNLRFVDDLTFDITNAADRRDVTRFRRVGDRAPEGGRGRTLLNITRPRDGDRVTGAVTIEGSSTNPNVEVVIIGGGRQVWRDVVGTRNGTFSVRTELPRGRYEAVVHARASGRQDAEERVRFSVGADRSEVTVDEPRSGATVDVGQVTFAGSSNSEMVQLDIFKGRDRVWSENVTVRGDRFSTRVNLREGHYDAEIHARDEGQYGALRRISFDVKSRQASNDMWIDKPTNGAHFGNRVDIEGRTGAEEVLIEITQGRDNVYRNTVSVRDGKFRARADLNPGRYQLVVSGLRGGHKVVDRRVSFDVR
jgi:hypothetical protein